MDAIKLCNSRQNASEFSPAECRFGDKCNLGHDLREYLKNGKRDDLKTFEGKCPVWEAQGVCHAGWKCRFVQSHMEEVVTDDGRTELRLTIDPSRAGNLELKDDEGRAGIFNVVSTQDKTDLSRRRTKTEKSDQYTAWVEKNSEALENFRNKTYHKKKEPESKEPTEGEIKEDSTENKKVELEDNRARYIEPPFRPSEKRKLYFGPETPVLAPLTTQGNLPFRRLCVELGAQLTYSEMAMTLPLIQGGKSEWSLMKAHESEISPPRFTPKVGSVVQGYEHAKDLKFGAQISSHALWQACKATEVMTRLVPHLRVIDLNCGCPIELVCRTGAGSALLDAPSKLEKIIRGMNAVSGEVPVSAKIRMGTKDSKPTANKVIERLAFGGLESQGPPGCAAITLHGRSKQQRYTRSANWEYISDCATLIKSYSEKKDALTDTANDPDPRQLPNGEKMYFIGNGDCYSHVDYYDHISNAGVDSVMVARGALIKPWLFEEIEKGQYIDKSATERLAYVEKYVRYGLQTWGSDEMGLGLTRRFLLEWLSFAHRYVPIGILDHLPPSLQDRPPAYRSRDDLETLLSSGNYKDWIKIRYVCFETLQ
jgi:tRNA-dihydrouridine synthase 3